MDLKKLSLSELIVLVKAANSEIRIRNEEIANTHREAQLERERNCDHEYIHTNAKYAGANQMRCMNCGKTIN